MGFQHHQLRHLILALVASASAPQEDTLMGNHITGGEGAPVFSTLGGSPTLGWSSLAPRLAARDSAALKDSAALRDSG